MLFPLSQLMNYRSDRETKLEILLNKICIASRHFEIKEMQGQVTSGDLIPMSTSLKIGWQERVTLHYLVVPIKRSNPSLEFSTLSFSSGNEVAPEAVSIVQLPDFMCRERAHEVFSVSQLLLQPLQFFVTITPLTVLFSVLVDTQISPNRKRKAPHRTREGRAAKRHSTN